MLQKWGQKNEQVGGWCKTPDIYGDINVLKSQGRTPSILNVNTTVKDILRRTGQILLAFSVLVLLLLQAMGVGLAAAESETIAASGTGLGGAFDTNLSLLAGGAIRAMHVILIVMTAIAGMMIVFGLEDGKKFIWQVMLGAGLAFNFGAFLMNTGVWSMADQKATTAIVEPFKPTIIEGSDDASGAAQVENVTILGDFVNHYRDKVITPGAGNITPYCLRLLVILTVVQATWELTMKFMSGDKLQYLISMTLKMGFFMFLMMNWIKFMRALMEGFQVLGTRAGGSSMAAGGDLISEAANAIVQICFKMYVSIYSPITSDGSTSAWRVVKTVVASATPGLQIIIIIILAVLVYCLFMVALEITMAYIEFYTMALLTIPCLSFGTMSKFSFLTEKAIGCMFNCALKVCVIAFIAIFSKEYLNSLAEELAKSKEPSQDLALLLQVLLASLLIYLLTKKIPQLVSGLISGSPQLSGSDMTGALKSAGDSAMSAATMATGTYGKYQAAKATAQAAGGGGLRGTLTQLARNSAMSTKPVRSYRDAIESFDRTKRNTGQTMLNNIRSGKAATSEDGKKLSEDVPDVQNKNKS